MLATVFKTDIYIVQYPDLQELQTILKEMIEPLPFSRYRNEMVSLIASLPPGVSSTVQHWLKKDPDYPPEFFHRHPRFSKILDFVNHHVKIFWDQLGYTPGVTPTVAQSWCQKYPEQTQGLAMHNHANLPIIGTLCFSGTTDSGKLVFQHPMDLLISQLPHDSWGRNSRLKPIDTVTGTLVLWPGYLPHAVSPNNSDLTRYTWNFGFYVPDKNPMIDAIKPYDEESQQ